jgi:hypothetical protein
LETGLHRVFPEHDGVVRAIEKELKYEEKVQDVAVVQQAFPREK